MARCPKCNREIDGFRAYQQVWMEYTVELEDGEFYVDSTGDYEDDRDGKIEVYCPLCSELLFKSFHKAEKFLRGEG